MKLIIRLLLIIWILLVLLILVTPSKADPISRPSDSPVPFATLEEAAKAGVAAALDRSVIIEYAGCVYRLNGQYFYTVPVSSGGKRDVAVRLAIPGSAILVALYHTHPSDLTTDVSDKFTDADIEAAKRLHVQSFVGVVRLGTVINYRPLSSVDKS